MCTRENQPQYSGAIHVFNVLAKAHPIARIFGYTIAGHHADFLIGIPMRPAVTCCRVFDPLTGSLRAEELNEIKEP